MSAHGCLDLSDSASAIVSFGPSFPADFRTVIKDYDLENA